MTKSTLSPFVVSDAKEVELADSKGNKKKYWKKEILPSGTRKYKDETLDFTKINPTCVKAFESGATGDVNFVFALSDNSHPRPGSEEIENLGGTLHKLELSEQGSLVGYFDLSGSEKALNAIKATQGKFGVSGRIEPDFVRSDTGEKFDYALTHVCGTTRPHVKGLQPWEAVELSDVEVDFDLKDKDIVNLSGELAVLDDKVVEEGKVNVEIEKDMLDTLLEMAKDHKETQAALAALEADKNKDAVVANLSEADKKRFDLAEAGTKQALELAEKAHTELAQTRWDSRKRDLALEGVPPVILTAAEKIMKHYKRPVITLSDGNTVDAASVIDEILDASKGFVNLSGEQGHGISDTQKVADREFEDLFKNLTEDLYGADFNSGKSNTDK